MKTRHHHHLAFVLLLVLPSIAACAMNERIAHSEAATDRLRIAVNQGDVPLVNKLLGDAVADVNFRSENGTLVHEAIVSELIISESIRKSVIESLLKDSRFNQFNAVTAGNHPQWNGYSALHLAEEFSLPSIVRLLLSFDQVDLNVRDATFDTRTPVMLAMTKFIEIDNQRHLSSSARYVRREILEIVSSFVSIDSKHQDTVGGACGWSPLQFAVKSGNLAAAKILLNNHAGVDVNQMRSPYCLIRPASASVVQLVSPLQEAALMNDKAMVEVILHHPSMNPETVYWAVQMLKDGKAKKLGVSDDIKHMLKDHANFDAKYVFETIPDMYSCHITKKLMIDPVMVTLKASGRPTEQVRVCRKAAFEYLQRKKRGVWKGLSAEDLLVNASPVPGLLRMIQHWVQDQRRLKLNTASLFDMMKTGSIQQITKVWKPTSLNEIRGGETMLHAAITRPAISTFNETDREWIVQSMLNEMSFSSVDVADAEGLTALHHAIERGQMNIVRMFMQSSHQMSKQSLDLASNVAMLRFAELKEERDSCGEGMLKLVLSSFTSEEGSDRQDRLMLAITLGDTDTVQVVLEHYKDSDSGCVTSEMLLFATKTGDEAMLQLLFDAHIDDRADRLVTPAMLTSALTRRPFHSGVANMLFDMIPDNSTLVDESVLEHAVTLSCESNIFSKALKKADASTVKFSVLLLAAISSSSSPKKVFSEVWGLMTAKEREENDVAAVTKAVFMGNEAIFTFVSDKVNWGKVDNPRSLLTSAINLGHNINILNTLLEQLKLEQGIGLEQLLMGAIRQNRADMVKSLLKSPLHVLPSGTTAAEAKMNVEEMLRMSIRFGGKTADVLKILLETFGVQEMCRVNCLFKAAGFYGNVAAGKLLLPLVDVNSNIGICSRHRYNADDKGVFLLSWVVSNCTPEFLEVVLSDLRLHPNIVEEIKAEIEQKDNHHIYDPIYKLLSRKFEEDSNEVFPDTTENPIPEELMFELTNSLFLDPVKIPCTGNEAEHILERSFMNQLARPLGLCFENPWSRELVSVSRAEPHTVLKNKVLAFILETRTKFSQSGHS